MDAAHAAELAGNRIDARALYEAALHALAGPDAASDAASLLRRIARTYMTDAELEAALDCAIAALAVSEANDDLPGIGHAINVQAAIHWARGDLDAAEPLFLEARAVADRVGDRVLAGMTSHNLGILANIRGDLDEAMQHYRTGLVHYRALGRLTEVCFALNNLGLLHTDLEQWSDADAAYAEAIEISERLGDIATRIGLEVNRAKMLIAQGDRGAASDVVASASRIADQMHDAVWPAEIAKLRGLLLRYAGDEAGADQQLTAAAELSERRHDSLLLAETLRERAELYRAQGRNRDALQDLNRAHKLFTQLRAKRELANIGRSVGRLEDDFLNLVKRWGESIEAKDRYTQGHCMRVADLACATAAACGIEEQSLFWFRIGALLHDVGKLIVPSEVLNKPGKLDDEEWQIMRRHPTAGVEILAGIDFPWDVQPLIESHHERWDGKGYPHGLHGDAIPLSARILAVADVYDALTTIRSYKKALTHDVAMEIMRRDVGAAFDPAVFAHFEAIMFARAA